MVHIEKLNDSFNIPSISKISFYKEKETGLWYADLPEYIQSGGTKEDCLMVSGADDWLEFLCRPLEDRVTLLISPDAESGLKEVLTKVSGDWDTSGATYEVGSYRGIPVSHRLWVCPVTLFVFGDYPKRLYYEVFSEN